MKKQWFSALLALTLLLGIACGCAAPGEDVSGDESGLGVILEDMGVPLGGLPPAGFVLNPSASGTSVEKNDFAETDYSNAKDGYVMVRWTGGGSPKIMVVIKGPTYTPQEKNQYQYYLRTDGEYDVLPLSDGNGEYNITVHKNISGTKYSTVLSASVNAQLTDEFAPFLRPNQYVNFTEDSEVVSMAQSLISAKEAETGTALDNLGKVGLVYEWVVTNLTYDFNRAKTVQPGYLPDVDSVMAEKKGICFDYAALMASMLRSQGVPVKLVVGYTSQGVYHAWINVWSEEGGWVEGMIYFDGKIWKLMDPTYASSGKQSNSIMQFINNSANYKEKYFY